MSASSDAGDAGDGWICASIDEATGCRRFTTIVVPGAREIGRGLSMIGMRQACDDVGDEGEVVVYQPESESPEF
jgi:hypothetical protein